MAEEQQTTKQHPIPQQVLGVEFKLVGDLTLKQFGYLAAFGVLAYAAYAAPLPTILRFILAFSFLAAGVGLALVPVQDQPLDQWIANLFRAIYAPTRWVWRKIAEPPEFLVAPVPKLAKPAKEAVSPEEAQRRLREYLATLKEGEELEPVDLAEKQRLEAINLEMQTIVTEVVPPTPPPTPTLEEIAPAAPSRVAETPKVKPKPPPPPAPPPPLPERRSEKAEEKPSLASTINYAAEPIFKLQRGTAVTYITTLQNVRVGRKLRPVTGETVFAPARERVITVEEKVPPATPSIPPVVSPPKPSEFAGPPAPPAPVAPPKPSVTEEPPKPVAPPTPPIEKAPPPPTPERIEKPLVPERIIKAPPPEKAKPPLVKEPNVINGVVYDKKGEVVEGMLVVVKSPTGETRRANKTNQLGQFFFSSLSNGRYLIELPKARPSFATMEVELTGKTVPLLELRPESRG